MDTVQFAIEMEEAGESFYWEIADKTENRGIKAICLMLARDEANHIKDIKSIVDSVLPDKSVSTIVEDAKKVFRRFTDDIFDVNEPLGDASLYKQALALERSSIDYYRQQLEKSKGDRAAEEFFRRVILEEEKHFSILEGIIDFGKYPQEWIDRKEFEALEKGRA